MALASTEVRIPNTPEVRQVVLNWYGQQLQLIADYIIILEWAVKIKHLQPLTFGVQIHLAAALQLLRWEKQGFVFHVEAGLPSGKQALSQVAQMLLIPGYKPQELSFRVTKIYLTRFAWYARSELGADVSIGEVNKDKLLDCVAEFLFSILPS